MSCSTPQNRKEPVSSCKITANNEPLRFMLFDPAKNITALVLSKVNPMARPFAASIIMKNYPAVEQVGFVYTDENNCFHLDMAGGEFCGNASISAACLYYAQNRQNNAFQEKGISLYVSGVKTPVWVNYDQVYCDGCVCTVSMPKPRAVFDKMIEINGVLTAVPVVDFAGIHHMISLKSIGDPLAESLVKQTAADLNADAVGLMQYDEKRGALRPLVYVPKADTVFWENSCASGTSALGFYMAKREDRPVTLTVRQPGGVLTVQAAPTGEVLLTNRCVSDFVIHVLDIF